MFIMPSFKKSLMVEQFQGNYLKCSKVFGTCIALITPPDWFKKRARLFHPITGVKLKPIRSKFQTNQDSLARVFPALCVSYMCLIGVLIGSLQWLCSLGLARMITLVLDL